MRQWAALLQPGQPGQYPPLFSGLGRPFSLLSLFPSNMQRKNA